MMDVLDRFHPAVASWFVEMLGEPTAPQRRAWPVLLEGQDVLVAAPTGSGKTLAAFLASLDVLAREAETAALPDEVRVVYVSPLKALSNDIHKNLMLPLEGVRERLARAGGSASPIRAAVRTGDTEGKERAAVLKRPPHVLVTTPESLYVLLTSASGRRLLSTARTLILDEIHAVCSSRRGAHLALSVERLERAVGEAQGGRRLQRIGLSATQKPVEEVARFLLGAAGAAAAAAPVADAAPRCTIVDEGHARALDLAVEIPPSPLEAVMSGEVWNEVVGRVADLVVEHKTTLVFVNTRRLAERVAARLEEALGERIGKRLVCAHHGSMSKDKRLDAEERLKAGKLRALVATSSLELGIDVGSVDLVCQIGVTRSIAALLQRVGRAGHHKSLVPKGRLFPLTRDELVEAAALVTAIRARDLDLLEVPTGGLDVLAQQLVACAGSEDAGEAWSRDALYAMVKRAWPYRSLSEKDFDDTLDLVVNGVHTQRGRRGAHLFLDSTTGAVRGRKGARLAALTSGGAIPDQGDYIVVESPTGATVGTINEDFAIESMPGDVFQLGTSSWRILRVERGAVRVEDAKGQPPSIPFWLGEAPARTRELSEHLSRMREEVEARATAGADVPAIARWLADTAGLPPAGALQLAEYLLATRAALGALPTTKRVIFERFLDELGGTQIVVHAPFGGRITRAWGLALRKRFCRSFDFELQAAATEDALLLSVGAVQGVDLTQLPHFLTSKTARKVLVQAVLDAPMFGTRFRWNATRALTMLRMRGGKRVPPGLQRIEAEDLLVSLFPEQQACLENIVGDREVPDAVLVRQTMDDCLNEYMDIEGLERVLADIEAGRIEVRCVDSSEPSPLAHEILTAKPYAFLDDAPLEERRVQAVLTRRTLDAAAQGESAALEPRLVAEVLAEVHPPVESLDEAWDALALAGFLRDAELHGHGGARMPALVDELVAVGRATKLGVGRKAALAARERLPELAALGFVPPATGADRGPSGGQEPLDRRAALLQLLRARAEVHAPRTAAEHAEELGLPPPEVEGVLAELVRKGELLAGRFDILKSDECTWSRRLVTRVRRRSLEKLRAEIEPVSPRDLMRFLFRFQRLDDPARGLEGLRGVLGRLDGVSVPAAAWEEEVLPARVEGYDPAWLDQLCLSGHLEWARIEGSRAGVPLTLRSTPIALVERLHAPLFGRAPVDDADLSSPARAVLELLKARGASFFADLARGARLLPGHAEAALAELVAAGLVTADGFSGLRALLLSSKDRERLRRRGRLALAGRAGGLEIAGRWALAAQAAPAEGEELDDDGRAEALARLLLGRTGLLFRKLVEREAGLPPWRDLLWALRRLEARGEVRGGRFVTGFSGEQFALPDAIPLLRQVRREPLEGRRVMLSASDPLNLTGAILPGARIAAVPTHRILFEDGLPVAVLDGAGVRLLVEGRPGELGEIEDLLRRRRLRRASGERPRPQGATRSGIE
jgi:ATP-dependent helicase Lhr and Lhr-like helicase